ncbi:MAG: DUF4446 family protein [Oscillospiraceae bacterium]|nr:DUF4446 family protein [Oscillospiraceae bacterium]
MGFFSESNVKALLIVVLVLIVAYTVLLILGFMRYRTMKQSYDMFMRGRDAASLEDIISKLINNVNTLQEQDVANKDVLRVINRNQVNTFQKTGVIKYNAFEGMGGQASFALALLDLNNTGIILNVIHSRSACYTYLKEIKNGECDVVLGAEERMALMQAVKKKDRFFNPDEKILD